MMDAATPKDDGQLKLRLPVDLKQQLKQEAVENSRSLTSEIIHRLRGTLDSNGAATRQASQ